MPSHTSLSLSLSPTLLCKFTKKAKRERKEGRKAKNIDKYDVITTVTGTQLSPPLTFTCSDSSYSSLLKQIKK
jgi:hypothetical protein